MKNKKETKSILVKTIEELKKDCYQEGRQEGISQGTLEMSSLLLKAKVPPGTIAEVSGLTVEEIEKS